MPTPSEGRALLFLAAVAALGLGLRGWRATHGPDPPAQDREALARQIAAVDSAVTSGGRKRGPRERSAVATPTRPAASSHSSSGAAALERLEPLEPLGADSPDHTSIPAPVDLDQAGAAELDALPGIGPALAARIIADREANGPFGSLEALQDVKGIGPALAARLAPRVTFSATPRPSRPKGAARDSPHP